MTVNALPAVTLAVTDMDRSVGFYQNLGFKMLHGGVEQGFSSFQAGDGYLNLVRDTSAVPTGWSNSQRTMEHRHARRASRNESSAC